jgi:hypothetical protein|tara:strand:+ start:3015 stop:3905 length:891 start_codon:yes stop_codon:yes gene_type:complete
MRRDAFPIWLVGSTKRNTRLATSMAQILGFDVPVGTVHRTRAINLFNYSYANPLGETILMNITLSPTMNNAMSVKGLTVLMTCIKKHTTMKTVEARYNYGVSNMVRLPWKPLHDTAVFAELLPHKTISTDIEDAIDAVSGQPTPTRAGQGGAILNTERGTSKRHLVNSGSLTTRQPRKLSMTMHTLPTNINETRRRAAYKIAVSNPTHGEEALHDIGRKVLESDGAILSLLIHIDTLPYVAPEKVTKSEDADPVGITARISRSSLNRGFGRGVKIRLHPEDFLHHFRLEAMCLIVE